MFLTGDSAVLSLEGAGDTEVAVHMQSLGAAPDAQPAGQNALPGTSNFFIGNDPDQWVTEVPQFGGVRQEVESSYCQLGVSKTRNKLAISLS